MRVIPKLKINSGYRLIFGSIYLLLVLVVVIKIKNDSFTARDINCREKNQLQCWEEVIDHALKTQGLNKAFEVLANLYSTEPAFAADCHSYAHLLGEKAYEKFDDGDKLEFSDKSSYCGYGFYHGFMENLILNGGGIEEAAKFCSDIGVQLLAQTADAEGACYHGIGHGAVDGGDPRAWGDTEAMLKPGISLCEEVTKQEHLLYRCVTGAYNSIEILSMDSKYGLSSLAKEPLKFCETQPTKYLEGCLSNMIPALLRQTDSDYKLAIEQIRKVKEPGQSFKIRNLVVEGIVYEMVRYELNNQQFNSQALEFCRDLDSNLLQGCIRGVSGGYLKYGEPQKEYIKAMQFCNSNLNDMEKDICHESVLSRLRIWYSKEKSHEICQQAELKFRSYCRY